MFVYWTTKSGRVLRAIRLDAKNAHEAHRIIRAATLGDLVDRHGFVESDARELWKRILNRARCVTWNCGPTLPNNYKLHPGYWPERAGFPQFDLVEQMPYPKHLLKKIVTT